MLKIEINEQELKHLINESVLTILKEYGIDIDNKNKKVGFNPNHQENVDTNDPWTPKPIYNEVNGYKVISIFERKTNEDGNDGNPLIYALKDKYGWELSNPSYDYFSLLRRFVAVCKELNEKFDTIMVVPSSNSLNTEILHKVVRLIKYDNYFEKFFYKENANDVYEYIMETNSLNNFFKDNKIVKDMDKMLYNSIIRMNKENNGVFSYKFISPSILRKVVSQTMSIYDEYLNDKDIDTIINDKNVLIIDDTVTSGSTISESAEMLCNHFKPKSVTFLTLFSPLTK